MITQNEQDKLAIQEVIDESGCQIIMVEGSNYLPSFAYTIGLWQQFQHPEIICFGLTLEVMQTILNNLKDAIEDSKVYEVNKEYDGILKNNVSMTFIPVLKEFYGEYVGEACRFYESMDFPLMQLIWPDKKAKYPWDKAYNKEFDFAQPLLDRDGDFFFYESKNLSIFTTDKVLNKEDIVRYVYHDEEGDWFFLEDEDIDDDNIKLASLYSLVKLDQSLNSIYYLQYGWEARRDSLDQDWEENEALLEE